MVVRMMPDGHGRQVRVMKNQRLSELRERAELTQEQLAQRIGISQSMIARIESGEREPRRATKLKLARIFETTVEWLFYEQVDVLRALEAIEHADTLDPTGTEGNS